MDSVNLFLKALDQATGVVGRVERECFDSPTPCDDWNMRELVNHLLYELSWVPDLLDGKTIAEVGKKYDGDLIGQDLASNWQAAAERSREAVKRLKPGGVAHLSYGDLPVEDYLADISNDLAVHAWDIAQGLNYSLRMGDDIVRPLYDKAIASHESLAGSGIFGSTAAPGPNAGSQQKLLALMGRPSEKWNATVASQVA